MPNRTRGRCAAIVAILASGPALADTVTFDTYPEGGHGETATFDGVTFYDINNVNGRWPEGDPFTPDEMGTHAIIERGDYLYNDFPDVFSPLNMLTFGFIYMPGANLSIGPLVTVTFSNGATLSRADWDVGFYNSGPWVGIELRTEALLGDEVVATSTYTVTGDPMGRDFPDAMHMSIEADAFDAVRLSAWKNGEPTTFRAVLDNVLLTEEGCASDFDGDGATNVGDLLAYLGDFRDGLDTADMDDDGSVNVQDLLAFLTVFRTGC